MVDRDRPVDEVSIFRAYIGRIVAGPLLVDLIEHP